MKAKLVKTVDGYKLFTQGFLKGSANHGLIESLNIEEGPIRYKLSLKNCQAIELASPTEEYILEVHGEGWDDHLYRGSRKKTEWEVKIEMRRIIDSYTIIGATSKTKGSGDKIPHYKSIPKLDAEGCLILKRI